MDVTECAALNPTAARIIFSKMAGGVVGNENLRQLALKTDVRELFDEQKLPCPGEPEDMRQYLAALAASTKRGN